MPIDEPENKLIFSTLFMYGEILYITVNGNSFFCQLAAAKL